MDNSMEGAEERDEEKLEDVNMENMTQIFQNKKDYRCNYPGCGAYFDRPYRLAQHILAHNNIRPYLCNHAGCCKAYTSKSHLDRHLRTVHMPQERDVVYSCPTCYKTFANRQNLKRHMNTVHDLEFVCEICDKQFKKKIQLSAHMYHHTGIKAFTCEICKESFISLYLKKRHMKYHKVYNCQECKVEFNHWSSYQKHLKAEHQKDEYICNDCGRSFKLRSHIVRHVKIHVCTRTFMCPYPNCERSYSRNSNLKQHILVKHMNIMHECTICHSQLSTKAKLNYHLNLHYNAGANIPPPPKPNIGERKKRKDEGTFKTSTALKLAGLDKAPEDTPPRGPALKQVHEELRTTLSGLKEVPDNIRSTLSNLTKNSEPAPKPNVSPRDAQPTSSESTKPPEDSNKPAPSDASIKTEYIEVEVDIPFDI